MRGTDSRHLGTLVRVAIQMSGLAANIKLNARHLVLIVRLCANLVQIGGCVRRLYYIFDRTMSTRPYNIARQAVRFPTAQAI